jgi:hypothetical protein
MDAGEAQDDGWNCRDEAEKHWAKSSEHVVKPATISILSQLRKCETVIITGPPCCGGRLQR